MGDIGPQLGNFELVGSRSEFRDGFVLGDVCCGLLKAAELALVLLYWHFTGADLISSTDCYVFIEFYRGFPGCKGLSLYRKFRDPDVF